MVRAGKAEPLSTRRLERFVQCVVARPVVPGYGGAPYNLLAALAAEPALVDAAQRSAKLRVPASLDALEAKALARLDARYLLSDAPATPAASSEPHAPSTGAGSVAGASSAGTATAASQSQWLLEGHDQVADLLGLLALEVDQAAARHKDPSDKVCARCRPRGIKRLLCKQPDRQPAWICSPRAVTGIATTV